MHSYQALISGTHQAIIRHLALEDFGEVVHQPLVKVLAAQVGVARGRLHLENALVDRQQRH
eukprot:6596070-Prymnesium_polylepis.1